MAGQTHTHTRRTEFLQQAVAFVEHEVLHVREVELLARHKLLDTAGRAHNNVLPADGG